MLSSKRYRDLSENGYKDLTCALYNEFSPYLEVTISELGRNILKEFLISCDSNEEVLV